MKRFSFLIALQITAIFAVAQDSAHIQPLTFSGYEEIYYQYDLNKPADGNRPVFMYSHNRHNEFNLNLGFVKANYTTEKLRANLAIAAGTFMNANYAAEPGVLKNIFEGDIGIKLCKKQNIWLDAGILPSHIGFETAVSKDCWTLTRSILAENSPYFEAGAKITYTTDDSRWLLSGMVLNGWQHITRVSGNSIMSWGTQIQFKPSDKILLNYSNFSGTDKPDSARLLRFFQNIYGIFTLNNKLGLTLGFDIGTEQKMPHSNHRNTWYSPVVMAKYSISHQWAITGRMEYYNDKNEVIISTNTLNGFQTIGYSLNIDFTPMKNVLIRLEGRGLNSKDNVFMKGKRFVRGDAFFTSSIAVSL
jgi:hypothetical protein